MSLPPGRHMVEAWTNVIGETSEGERVSLQVDTTCQLAATPYLGAAQGCATATPGQAAAWQSLLCITGVALLLGRRRASRSTRV
jgi:hypothetical protein